MPLAEAAAIAGLIGLTITVIDKSREVYDAASNVEGLHQAFLQVSQNIPLVLNILRNCKKIQDQVDQQYSASQDAAFKDSADESAKAVRPILETCKANAEKLGAIFEKVIPGDDAGWFERYKKAVKQVMPGKQRKVEDLMSEILRKLDLLRTDRFFKNEVEKRHEALDAAIQKLAELPSSLAEDDGRYVHHGTGPMNVNAGGGTQTNNTMSGGSGNRMFNGQTQHFGKE